MKPALPLLLLAAAFAAAEPPKLDIPPELKPAGDYARLSPKTDAKAVAYIGLSGVDPFPSEFLKDPRAFVLPTRGLKPGSYRFAAVGTLNDEQTVAYFAVVVGDLPTVPPVDPPAKPPGGLYFLIVRPDGPAAPAFTRAMQLPAWGELRKKGHLAKDKTVTEASAMGFRFPADAKFPAVLTLRTSSGESEIVRDLIPLPDTDAGVLALSDGVK